MIPSSRLRGGRGRGDGMDHGEVTEERARQRRKGRGGGGSCEAIGRRSNVVKVAGE